MRSRADRPAIDRAAVVGESVSRSLSPAIFARLGTIEQRPIEYGAIDVQAATFVERIRGLQSDRFVGVNVTIPHKAAAAALAGERSHDVEALDAANVLHFQNGTIVAHNTDVGGFTASLRDANVSFQTRDMAVVYGAGGAAAAVILACARSGARRIAIVNRTVARAERLAASVQGAIGNTKLVPAADDAFEDVAVYVNATPIGDPFRHPRSASAAAIDLTYRPRITPFMEAAKAHGLRATNGLSMLVDQAIATYEIWFGPIAHRDAVLREITTDLEAIA